MLNVRKQNIQLIREQNKHFNKVKFVNLSISSLGVFAKECSSFLELLCTKNDDDCHPSNILYFLLSKQGVDESELLTF